MSDGQYFRQGKCSALNLSGAAQLIMAVPKDFAIGQARLVRVNVLVAGSAAGSVNDAATVAAAATANQIFVIPNTVGSYLVDWPILSGIVVTPGTGQTVAIVYE